MFKGSLPADAIRIISEIASKFDTKNICIGCSGNFTIERALFDKGKLLHSNDVSMYSCSLGRLFAGMPLQISVGKDYVDEWGWLNEYLDTPVRAVSTVMLCTNMFVALGKKNAYYERMKDAYIKQWKRLHMDTTAKLGVGGFRVESFHAGDAVDWVETIRNDEAFISFPPFWTAGYEKLNAELDRVFEWERPLYPVMDEARRGLYFKRIMEKDHWMFGTNAPIEGLEDRLNGICKTVSKGVTIYMYSSSGPARRVGPKMGCEKVTIPRLNKGEVLGNKLELIQITGKQFNAIRAQYLSANIVPGSAPASFGVLVDGLLIGCFSLNTIYRGIREPNEYSPHIYIYSDFAVGPTDYPRLSKLVLYAAMSKEVKLLAERLAKKRINGVLTSAFARYPVSMKYRGLMEMTSRQFKEEKGEYLLNYHALMGQWTLQEGFEIWKRKYLGVQK